MILLKAMHDHIESYAWSYRKLCMILSKAMHDLIESYVWPYRKLCIILSKAMHDLIESYAWSWMLYTNLLTSNALKFLHSWTIFLTPNTFISTATLKQKQTPYKATRVFIQCLRRKKKKRAKMSLHRSPDYQTSFESIGLSISSI